ncbi:MAG: long-chain-fatty-acid--CoA ligase [Pseudohongiellaceae bacterium]
MKNNIGLLLSKRASINPNSEAYVGGSSEPRLTFAQLNSRCNQLANSLLTLGVQPGDRVSIAMMNSAEFIEAFFAIAKIGAVVVPLNWRLVSDELEFILKDSGTTVLLYGDEFSATMSDLKSRGEKTDVLHWVALNKGLDGAGFAIDYQSFRDAGATSEPEIGSSDDDFVFIMYTSGTTGLPKGVVHSHNTCLWAVFTFAASCDLRGGDRYLVALPLFHVGSLTPVILNIQCGVTSVVMREFNPATAWQLIQNEKVNNSLLVPAMLNFMSQVPDIPQYDYSSVRWIQSGASPLPVSLIQTYADMDIDIHQIYGLTETCGPACVISAEHAMSKIGSTGRAFFYTDVKIVDENGEDCKPNVQGEVWVSGKHIMVEYWNRPDATRETITPEGWLKTGDIATVDEDGFVFIQDRMKDMIISGGENVYPAEIENIILSHPQVAEVAVIGQPSEKWGESPFAVVVFKNPGIDPGAVIEHCQGKLANFKLPKGAAAIDLIPRNANGKVLKRELRLQYPGPAKE